MLDIRFIRENRDLVAQNIKERVMNVSLDNLLSLDEERRKSIQELEELSSRRNIIAKEMKSPLNPQERNELVEEGKNLKALIAEKEKSSKEIEREFYDLLSLVPNMRHPNSPVGNDESGNKEIERVGEIPQFSFPVKDHVILSEELDIIDFERASVISGSKFYFLKNQGAFLDLALQRYAMDFLNKRGFPVYITPDLAKMDILEGIGFNPRGDESNIYNIEGTDLCLVGTAEITLGGFQKDKILDFSEGPIYMAGLSHCFRREAGAAGQFSRGLYRVHQFTKVEMFCFCPEDQSEAIHHRFLELEKEFFASLNIPYRVLDICSQDLGAPAYRKYDIEAWMPGRGESGEYGEVTSTSNCTDYQSRRLKIRYRDEEGKLQYAHMINGTAVATSRAIIAILENNQQEDGSILIPEILIPYTGFSKIEKKNI